MRKTFARLLWFSLGTLLTVAFIECVLRLLPVSMGLHRTGQAERWPLQSMEPRVPYTYSIAWSMLNAHRGVTNNYGHIAPFDYRKGSRPVIVVGDSYVESLMNEYSDTLQGQLGRRMGAPESVYGLGVSGLSASDYLALSQLARNEFMPAAAVFVMTDGDLSESLIQRLGNYFLVPDGNGLKLDYWPAQGESLLTRIRNVIGDISIHRYLQVNLQFSPDQLVKVFRRDDPKLKTQPPTNDADGQRKVADWFLTMLPPGLGLPSECIVFLMDSDRYAIYKPALASPRKDTPEARRYFIEHAQALGFKVSDLDLVFRSRYAGDPTKFDHWPIDRHWNKVGHGIGADEAYRLLFQPGPQQRACRAASRPELQQGDTVRPG